MTGRPLLVHRELSNAFSSMLRPRGKVWFRARTNSDAINEDSVTRGWLGVQIQPVTEELAKTYKMKDAKGAVIAEVTENSPAEKAGLKPDDVVVGVDGREVEDNGDLSSYIASKKPQTTVNLAGPLASLRVRV